MIKNIIFIILFVVLYGGLFLFINGNAATHTDRNDYGEFLGSTYNSDHFSVKIEYDEDWLVFDGISIEESLYSRFTQKEIENSYGASIEKIKFLSGAASPQAYITCVAIAGENIPEERLNESSMKTTLEYMKTGITEQGGIMGSTTCYTVDVNGSGNKMIIYGYDYQLNGEKISNFNCFTNSDDNTLVFSGTYENAEGLKQLIDFVENKLYFYPAA